LRFCLDKNGNEWIKEFDKINEIFIQDSYLIIGYKITSKITRLESIHLENIDYWEEIGKLKK